jgi:hypothetical protein
VAPAAMPSVPPPVPRAPVPAPALDYIDTAKVALAVQARERGKTLRASAEDAGIGLSTLCRWQAADNCVKTALAIAHASALARIQASAPKRVETDGKPRVQSHRECPQCSAPVEVREVQGKWARLWRCSRQQECGWKSWRPRHVQDCACGGPRYWSWSRKTVYCPACDKREWSGVLANAVARSENARLSSA